MVVVAMFGVASLSAACLSVKPRALKLGFWVRLWGRADSKFLELGSRCLALGCWLKVQGLGLSVRL